MFSLKKNFILKFVQQKVKKLKVFLVKKCFKAIQEQLCLVFMVIVTLNTDFFHGFKNCFFVQILVILNKTTCKLVLNSKFIIQYLTRQFLVLNYTLNDEIPSSVNITKLLLFYII